ncbi:ExeA family protein [Gilvimarinus agarilyticus]|uniref:ExeA family protein n=1 Tax=Gilvimarinus agarilyticus TaxID=679259 RepID=UPI00059EDC1B|nr:ExeA family protein [Gilvimarinus agarilyticus]
MYHQYFGLVEPAFSIAVNPRYLYMSDQHKEALAHLLYGVRGGGFVLLTGEVGTGKTTIIRSLLEQLPENTDVAMVFNPMANVPEMLGMICDELGVKYVADEHTVKSLTDALHLYLLENHRRGRNTVLLIDEAQLLSADALEQIRLLTNLETDTKKLLQIILVGQPELNTLLSQPRLRQLAQRITARFHLLPLTLSETEAYIAHRLQVAGLSEERNPFPRAIVKKIHRFSGGIPRRINILCERALVGLYGHNKQRVDSATYRLAKREVIGGLHDPGKDLRGWLVVGLGAALVVVIAILLWVLWPSGSEPKVPPQQRATPAASTAAASEITVEQPAAPVPEVTAHFARLRDAQQALFDHVGLATGEGNPCWQANADNIQCETAKFTTWAELRELNRPVVLTLNTPDKFTVFAVVVGLGENRAVLIDSAGERMDMPLTELGRRWNGAVFYVWHRPQGYNGAISQGDQGPLVNWLAEQFARLDGQSRRLANNRFNQALSERLKIFQRQAGLTADGILGQRTLLKLNEQLGIDTTLEPVQEP